MNVIDVFRLWQGLAGDPTANPWGPDNVYGFFQTFRPYGDGLEKALLPLPQGQALLERMRPIFPAAIEGSQNAASFDAYFIVRKPAPISSAAAEAHLVDHLQNVARIASSIELVELVDLLQEPTLSVSHGSPPDTQDRHTTDIFIYDALCVWVGSLAPEPDGITALGEAFYSIACDYHVAWYLM